MKIQSTTRGRTAPDCRIATGMPPDGSRSRGIEEVESAFEIRCVLPSFLGRVGDLGPRSPKLIFAPHDFEAVSIREFQHISDRDYLGGVSHPFKRFYRSHGRLGRPGCQAVRRRRSGPGE